MKPAPSRRPLLYFLLFYTVLAFAVHSDFGLTWDESDVYMRGTLLQNSFGTGKPGLLVEKHEDPDGNEVYNHTYGMLLSLANPDTDVDRFHGLNLAAAALGYAAAYELVFQATGDPRAALLGPVFLLLNPRFFGHSVADPKDMPFAVFNLVFLALLAALPNRRFAWKTAILGLALFLVMSQRLAGGSLVLLAAFWDLSLAPAKDRLSPGRTALHLTGVSAIAFSLLLATWPYLRLAPLAHLWEILNLTAHFPYNGTVLFMGKVSPVHGLPASYPWVWLGIGVPLGILALALSAPFLCRPWREKPAAALVLSALGLNLGLILLLRPFLYDGLRHLLFLLPLLSVAAALGAWEVWRLLPKGLPRSAFLAVLVLANTSTAFRMADLHPYEYVYFNEAVGGLRGAEGRFETDYWGAAYREAATWLRDNELADPKRAVKIHSEGMAFQCLAFLADRPVHWVPVGADWDYFISSTRGGGWKLAGNHAPIYTVVRDGVTLCYVFKR